MQEDKEIKQTTITFRTNEKLKSKLESMAAKEHRTLSNFIEMKLSEIAESKKK